MINNAEVAAGENKENALPEICILYDFVLVPARERKSDIIAVGKRGREAGSTSFKPDE